MVRDPRYRHPALDRAARQQLERMSHVMFGGLTHAPAVGLVERLLALTPAPLQHAFLCDSGSVSVEVAVKMTLQAAVGRAEPQRRRLFTVRGRLPRRHVRSDERVRPGRRHARAVRRRPAPAGLRAPAPAGLHRGPGDPELQAWVQETTALFERHADELAAVVVKPVLQGAGGMHVHSPECLRVLRRLCDEHGVLLVLDEIATGFGRTGTMFAAEHAGVVPDVLCVGKSLTGG